MSELIEECLRARGVRYFRGHHEQEYFYLVDYLHDHLHDSPLAPAARRARVHVHLERPRDGDDEIIVTVTPDRFFPAADADLLAASAAHWRATSGAAAASVHPSSDRTLLGVVVSAVGRPADVAALAALVDDTVSAAVDLFGRLRRLPGASPAALREAG